LIILTRKNIYLIRLIKWVKYVDSFVQFYHVLYGRNCEV